MSLAVCSVSKTETQITSYSNFMKIEMSELTSKNVLSNGCSFQNSETTIAFIALKRVRRWSHFLISSLSWPYTQNVTTVKLTIY